MIDKVYNVNNKVSGQYHHGDLRSAVISLCLKRLERQRTADLGLRALARELGVSATALYRHFPSKDELLDELAAIGLERLSLAQLNAIEEAGGGRNGFKESGVTYILWALANPALFRITFSRLSSIHSPKLSQIRDEALSQLQNSIAQANPMGQADEDHGVIAIKAWSVVHGLANLILDGAIESDEKFIRKVLTTDSV